MIGYAFDEGLKIMWWFVMLGIKMIVYVFQANKQIQKSKTSYRLSSFRIVKRACQRQDQATLKRSPSKIDGLDRHRQFALEHAIAPTQTLGGAKWFGDRAQARSGCGSGMVTSV